MAPSGSPKRDKARSPSRRDILQLALDAELDPRTVKRALALGLHSMKAKVARDRLARAAARRGIEVFP